MMSLKGAAEILSLGFKPIFAIFLGTGLLLFGGDTWLGISESDKFLTSIRGWTVVVFYISGAFSVITIVGEASKAVMVIVDFLSFRKKGRLRLDNLAEDEKKILYGFFIPDEPQVQRLPTDDPVVRSLVGNGILESISSIGGINNFDATYQVSDWARKYIDKDHEKLIW